MIPHYDIDPNVIVFTLFPGLQGELVADMLRPPKLRAIVMRSFGSGNAPQRPWLINLLKEAQNRGVNVVNISQCGEGMVEMGRYDTGYQLQSIGVTSGYDSTVECAVAKLMYLQGLYKDYRMVRHSMNCNLRGEITL